MEQLSQQVMIASSTIPLELCDENSTPSDSQEPQNVQEILCEETVNDEDEDIVISEKLARKTNRPTFDLSRVVSTSNWNVVRTHPYAHP